MIGDKELLESGQRWLEMVSGISYSKDNCVWGLTCSNRDIIKGDAGYCCGGLAMEWDYRWERSRLPGNYRKINPVAINTRIQFGSHGYAETFGKTHGGLLEKDYFEQFYHYLFHLSPFRDAYVTKDIDGLREGGVVVVRCEGVPANLSVAASICIRRGWEYTSMSRSLVNLINLGVDPRLAHMVAYQMTVEVNGEYCEVVYRGHQGVYSQSLNKEGIKNFLEGALPGKKYVEGNTKSFSQLKTYSGVIMMWNIDKHEDLDKRRLCFIDETKPTETHADPFKLISRIPKGGRKTIQEVIEQGLEEVNK